MANRHQLGAVLTVVALSCSLPAVSADTAADAIFYNGKVIVLGDAGMKIVQGFAIKDGRYLVVGPNGSVSRFSGPDTRMVNLEGRTVIPGLSDSHFHNIGGGPGIGSLQDAIARRSVRRGRESCCCCKSWPSPRQQQRLARSTAGREAVAAGE